MKKIILILLFSFNLQAQYVPFTDAVHDTLVSRMKNIYLSYDAFGRLDMTAKTMSMDTAKVNLILANGVVYNLSNFATTSALSSYGTISAFNTAIANYSTTTQMNTALSSYPTTSNLNSTLAGYFLLSGKNTVADSTIFSDNIFTVNVYPTTTNVSALGTSSKQFTNLFLQNVPKIGNISMNDITSMGASTSAGITGILGLLGINKIAVIMRDGTTFSMLVLPP